MWSDAVKETDPYSGPGTFFFQDFSLQLAAPNHSTSQTQSKADLEVTDCNTATPSNLSEHSFLGFSS